MTNKVVKLFASPNWVEEEACENANGGSNGNGGDSVSS